MHTKIRQKHVRSRVPLMALLTSVAIFPAILFAAPMNGVEVKPFGLLDVDAYFSAKYLFSDLESGSSSSSLSSARQSTWEEEISLAAMGYVYHPGFLTVNFGGGPLFIQRDTSDESLLAKKNETLVNFFAGLEFLKLKPYPFSTYFRRSHPALSSSLSTRFVTEKDEYGLEGLVVPGGPFRVSYKLSHSENEGSDFGTVVDEIIDLGEISLKTIYRGNDHIDIFYDQSTRDSASGSAGLPIRRSKVRRSNTRIFARNTFGEDRPFYLNQNIQRLVHDSGEAGDSEVETRSYTASGRVALTESVQTAMSVSASDTLRVGADANVRSAQASVNHSLSERVSYGISLRREGIRQTSFDRDMSSIDGNFSYSQPTDFGSISFGANLRKDRTDQTSGADTVLVFDEPVTLAGTIAVDLRNEFVVSSSVVVSNTGGTQIFIDGIDYRLVIIGSITSVQRLITGNIFDGQVVLVDYEFETSGTAEFETTSAGVSVSANFLRHFVARARYNTSDLTVISGELTTPKNDRDYIELGLDADTQVGRWTVGGGITFSELDEEISPSTRESISINASTRIVGSVRLNVSAGLSQLDLENSPEDSDRTDIRIGLSGRAWRGAQFRFDTVYSKDTGGSLLREDWAHVFNLQWRYRSVLFTVDARYADNTLGESLRRRKEIAATVRRKF